MATYDYTGDGDGSIFSDFYRKRVLLKREMKTTDIVASNSTLTTNGVIAAADIIQFIDIPQNFCFTNCCIRTITAEGAALTADIGIAGSTEIFSNFSLNATANAITFMAVGATWGPDNLTGRGFTAADTLDMTFDSETDAGEWHIYIAGFFLD